MSILNNVKVSLMSDKLFEIIFEADSKAGKRFDIILLVAIIVSIVLVMAESIHSLQMQYSNFFYYTEWILTILFTIEYLLRLYVVKKPFRYMTSFFGIIDLLSILPSYLSMVFAGTHYFLVIRGLRLLRVFRILKITHFTKEGRIILNAMKASKAKISIFLFFVLIVVVIIGSVMYVVEGAANESFSSIPQSIYWAIVTLTTVGYGDIAPITPFGQFLAAIIMILGYAVIAVPTGIVSSELTQQSIFSNETNTQVCINCNLEEHRDDASFCRNCGHSLNSDAHDDDPH